MANLSNSCSKYKYKLKRSCTKPDACCVQNANNLVKAKHISKLTSKEKQSFNCRPYNFPGINDN